MTSKDSPRRRPPRSPGSARPPSKVGCTRHGCASGSPSATRPWSPPADEPARRTSAAGPGRYTDAQPPRRASVYAGAKTRERRHGMEFPRFPGKALLTCLTARRTPTGRSLAGLAGADVLHPVGLTSAAGRPPGADRRTARQAGAGPTTEGDVGYAVTQPDRCRFRTRLVICLGPSHRGAECPVLHPFWQQKATVFEGQLLQLTGPRCVPKPAGARRRLPMLPCPCPCPCPCHLPKPPDRGSAWTLE